MSEIELTIDEQVANAMVALTRMGYDLTVTVKRVKQNAMDQGLSEEAAERIALWMVTWLKEEVG